MPPRGNGKGIGPGTTRCQLHSPQPVEIPVARRLLSVGAILQRQAPLAANTLLILVRR